MEEPFLYRQISEQVRKDILSGALKPGDRLPSVQQMAARWDCTIGTVQRAYQDLVRHGLVVSRPGQGTRVADFSAATAGPGQPLRHAALVNRSEAFLLEMLSAGYSLQEIDGALRQASERWRIAEQQVAPAEAGRLRFVGSHDPLISWLAGNFGEIVPGYTITCEFSGSLGGLLALAEGKADLAGCHLLDEESGEYNLPFVRRFFPAQRIALVTLAHRRLGLILPPGNPDAVISLADLRERGLRLANRQPGSGTRVWLDQALHQAGIRPDEIPGYQDTWMTHSAVARQVAQGDARAGIGLETAARSYGLDFILLARERYDLVLLESSMGLSPVSRLISWLQSAQAGEMLAGLGGYDAHATGQVVWSG
jgi:putative molybdopterin biosynthesis protein